jgi:post-segregation antitoxin (ccd killing protein)
MLPLRSPKCARPRSAHEQINVTETTETGMAKKSSKKKTKALKKEIKSRKAKIEKQESKLKKLKKKLKKAK